MLAWTFDFIKIIIHYPEIVIESKIQFAILRKQNFCRQSTSERKEASHLFKLRPLIVCNTS